MREVAYSNSQWAINIQKSFRCDSALELLNLLQHLLLDTMIVVRNEEQQHFQLF